MTEEPRNLETNLLREFMPLLNRPHTGVSSTTGYRSHTDSLGKSNVSAAVEFMTALDKLPRDNDGKVDVRLLNADWDPASGTAAPTENFRRGLLELGAQSFLENSYPEWIGDALDDANQDIESLAIVGQIKWMGWEWFNDMLNTTPTLDEDEDEVYPEDNILFLDYSAIANELFVLMRGRAESARIADEQRTESIARYRATQAGVIAWMKEQGIEVVHDDSDVSSYTSPFYSTPDGLTRYIVWDNPYRLVAKLTRPNSFVDWDSDRVVSEHYEH